MKRLFLALGLFLGLLLLGSPAEATTNFVQGTASQTSTVGSTIALAYGSNVGAGHSLYVCTGFTGITQTISSVNGSTNGAYTAIGSLFRGSTLSNQCFRKDNSTAGAETVTVTLSATTSYREIHIEEYSGPNTSNSFDVSATATGSGTSVAVGPITTTAANELILGYFFGANTMTCPSDMTQRTSVGSKVCDKTVTSTGSYSETATQSPTGEFEAWLIGFKDATQPGGGGSNQGIAFLSPVSLVPITFANLPSTPQNGMLCMCSDCTIANPCASGGTGALAKRLNGVWVCN